jgi:hypothetical protein
MIEDIKIACTIPIGSLSKFGYQYHWKTVLNNASKVFDLVYLVTTVRENSQEQFQQYSNVRFIKSPDFLFTETENSKEHFDIYKIYKAYNESLKWAKEDGMDFCLFFSINQYVNTQNSNNLRELARKLYTRNMPFGLCGKAFQIGSVMCYTNTKTPTIINIKHIDDIVMYIDVLDHKGKRIGWQGGLYEDPEFFKTDIYGSFTPRDLEEKYEWYERSYMKDWKGIDPGLFNLDLEITKFRRKLRKLAINQDYEFDETGIEVASQFANDCFAKLYPPKFASYWPIKLKSYLQKTIQRTPFAKLLGNN